MTDPITTIDATIRARWAQALEDNEHLRCLHAECEFIGDEAKFCAFGMLGRLYERDRQRSIFRQRVAEGDVLTLFMNYDDEDFRAWLGEVPVDWTRDNALVGRVVDMNDALQPWAMIAEVVRRG